jgi:hypothetical protein
MLPQGMSQDAGKGHFVGARFPVELCVKVACHHPGRAGQNLHQSTTKTLAECNHSEPWLTVEISVKVKFPTFLHQSTIRM